jgi:hypothetical protein
MQGTTPSSWLIQIRFSMYRSQCLKRTLVLIKEEPLEETSPIRKHILIIQSLFRMEQHMEEHLPLILKVSSPVPIVLSLVTLVSLLEWFTALIMDSFRSTSPPSLGTLDTRSRLESSSIQPTFSPLLKHSFIPTLSSPTMNSLEPCLAIKLASSLPFSGHLSSTRRMENYSLKRLIYFTQ